MANDSIPFHSCPLCSTLNPDVTRQSQQVVTFRCGGCGTYAFANAALDQIYNNEDVSKILALYVIDRNHLKVIPVFYVNRSDIPADVPAANTTIDDAVKWFPESLEQRLDFALLNLAKASSIPGSKISVGTKLIDPMFLARSPAERIFTLETLADEGFINWDQKLNPRVVSLKSKGWTRVSDLKRGAGSEDSNQVFVAMSFDKSQEILYDEAIAPAIKSAGFFPVRMDRIHHADRIEDVMFNEMRRCKFMVADFTHHNQNVYFEVGFMLGLGRKVICTCKEDHFQDSKFDTAHINHIVWNNYSELLSPLTERIKALFPIKREK